MILQIIQGLFVRCFGKTWVVKANSVLKILYPLFLVYGTILPVHAQTIGTLLDTRDGQRYPTVTYTIASLDSIISDLDEYESYASKTQSTYEVIRTDHALMSMTWMAENLNYDVPGSKCFYDTDVDCTAFGRKYTWTVAKNVCPEGWHLPSDDEWYLLANLYGGVAVAGEHLKSTTLGGSNKSLFEVSKATIFWSSDEIDAENAWDWKVNFRWVKLQRWKGGKGAFNSVRCVQDY